MIRFQSMELEPVRAVLHNDVNDVSVCADLAREDGGQYTVVSVFDTDISKQLAQRIVIDGLFSQNSDYLGHLAHKDALLLVFRYQRENLMSNKQGIYATTFAKRKSLVLSLLTALAEADFPGDVGKLLIAPENLNISSDGNVYLNYFLDFSRYTPSAKTAGLYRDAAELAFSILTEKYEQKYDRQIESYPAELRLMFKKLENDAFKSYSQLMTFVQTLPDSPRETRTGPLRVLNVFERFRDFLVRNPANIFMSVVVVVTVIYLGYQVIVRIAADRQFRENTVFVGLDMIGEVSMGEEGV